jgi:hypothetical protein
MMPVECPAHLECFWFAGFLEVLQLKANYVFVYIEGLAVITVEDEVGIFSSIKHAV